MEKYTEYGRRKSGIAPKSFLTDKIGINAIISMCLTVCSIVIEILKEISIEVCITSPVITAVIILLFLLPKRKHKEWVARIAVALVVLQLILIAIGLYCEEIADNTPEDDQMDTNGITTGVILSEPTNPSSDAPRPTEMAAPAIQPSIEIYFSSSADGVATFKAVTIPEDIYVEWDSEDELIAVVDQGGRVSARSEGSAVIVASFTFGGEVYADKVTVTVTGEPQVTETGTIRYFKSLPTGIDTEHSDFQNVRENESIYFSQTAALKAVGLSEDTGACSGEKLVGYVYFHWCRGQSIRETESHNRTSGATKSWHYSSLLQKDVWCDSFSCFFSDAYLSESEMNVAVDGSGCMWFENYAVCNDSYWYWPIPVYECKYEISQNRLSIDWKE